MKDGCRPAGMVKVANCFLCICMFHECHIYDQSGLSMLLNRLYHTDLENHMMKRHKSYEYCSKGEQFHFFPGFFNDYLNESWMRTAGMVQSSKTFFYLFTCITSVIDMISECLACY